ncbi:MAG: hypothetical protein JSS82_03615 [Bacteroidetes bacterium]|nr:hypothetical protein [Bacteroidota bacterium]
MRRTGRSNNIRAFDHETSKINDGQIAKFIDKYHLPGTTPVVVTNIRNSDNPDAKVRLSFYLPDHIPSSVLAVVIVASLLFLFSLTITTYVNVVARANINIRMMLLISTIIGVVMLIAGGILCFTFWKSNPKMDTSEKVLSITPLWLLILLVFPFLQIHQLTQDTNNIDWSNAEDASQYGMAVALIFGLFVISSVVSFSAVFVVRHPSMDKPDVGCIPMSTATFNAIVENPADGVGEVKDI